jgi:hypothetical protein
MLTHFKDGSGILMERLKMPGACIGLGAAAGIVVGALLDNVALWLCIGAGLGVVLSGILVLSKGNK